MTENIDNQFKKTQIDFMALNSEQKIEQLIEKIWLGIKSENLERVKNLLEIVRFETKSIVRK